MPVPNGQFRNYDTDQFVDPYNGYTVHDDGTDIYVSPYTKIHYQKIRTYNGVYTDSGGSTYPTYRITLIPRLVGLTDEQTGDILVSEDGTILISDE